MDHEDDYDTNCKWWSWKDPQRFNKGTRRHRNQRISTDHSEKGTGDLKRLPVIQTLVENDQLMLVWKNLRGMIIIIFSKPTLQISSQG